MRQRCYNHEMNIRKYFSYIAIAMNMKTESLEDGWKKVYPISPEIFPLLILMIYNNERNKTTQRPLVHSPPSCLIRADISLVLSNKKYK